MVLDLGSCKGKGIIIHVPIIQCLLFSMMHYQVKLSTQLNSNFFKICSQKANRDTVEYIE